MDQDGIVLKHTLYLPDLLGPYCIICRKYTCSAHPYFPSVVDFKLVYKASPNIIASVLKPTNKNLHCELVFDINIITYNCVSANNDPKLKTYDQVETG